MVLIIAGILVALIGICIRWGNTCLVASTEQWIHHGNPTKLLEIVNSWLWVMLLVTVLHLSGLMNLQTGSYEVSWMTFAGGGLLGLGAFLNKACAVGTVSKLGGGNLNYALTPVGMLLAIYIHDHLPIGSPEPIFEESIITKYPIVFLVISIVILALLFRFFARKSNERKSPLQFVGLPTTIIALCFVLLLLLRTPWSYTEVLSDIARNNLHDESGKLILFGVFFASVCISAISSKTTQWVGFNFKTGMNCFLGGAVIGFGSQLIIGSHDSITLYGFPLLLMSSAIAMSLNLAVIGICAKLFK